MSAVVPGYYLVCYNSVRQTVENVGAVVPGYYLVCYNGKACRHRKGAL